MKRVHLIAIGGAIMHNLAIALKNGGYHVTGSDDIIYDPAKSNLEEAGLSINPGWDESNVSTDLDAVIVGMHARINNPELLKAQQLGLKIMSFPEFVSGECSNKKRLVVAGSHGKTTTTAMIMHVLSKMKVDFDYLVGSSIDGFNLSVKLSNAPLIVIEGDEYLSSPIDLRSKFVWYKPHISIITGIAYDHINVFPTFESYVKTFKDYVETHVKDGKFYWFASDTHLKSIAESTGVSNESYATPNFESSKNGTVLSHGGFQYQLDIVGKHNLENLLAAQLACTHLGIQAHDFYTASTDFTGAGKRMEKIHESDNQVVYRDFAHSPSKLKATTEAIKETYKGRLVAVFELHTFSSLNKDFLPLYKGSMSAADEAIVFYDDEVFKHRQMEPILGSYVQDCFRNVVVLHDKKELETVVNRGYTEGANILLMSSGNFANADFTFN